MAIMDTVLYHPSMGNLRSLICTMIGRSCTIAILCLSASAHAQQLSYPDGQTLVIQNDGAVHSAQFNYSLRDDLAVGVFSEFVDGPDTIFIGGQLTYLVKRVTGDKSQFNVIVSGGAGHISGPSDDHVDGASAFLQLSGDYASRRLFSSYAIRGRLTQGADTALRQTARLGVSPYLAQSNKLQPFIAIQVDRFDGPNDRWRATPFVRLIKGPAVGELGVNTDGGVMANLIILF